MNTCWTFHSEAWEVLWKELSTHSVPESPECLLITQSLGSLCRSEESKHLGEGFFFLMGALCLMEVPRLRSRIRAAAARLRHSHGKGNAGIQLHLRTMPQLAKSLTH